MVVSWVSLSGCGQPACDGVDCGHDHGQGTAHHTTHPVVGPHHGQLVELGSDEYHAELVPDVASETLTVYLLDAAALNAVGAEASGAKINLVQNGTTKQFMLSASPQLFDAPGESSRFVADDAAICHELENAAGSAQLVLTIRGKQYRGKIDGHYHDVAEKSILIK